MSKILQVGAVGYISKAGTNGLELDAGTSGSEADRVWYRVPHGLAGTLWEGVAGKDIHEAYLNPDQRQQLENYGEGSVVYKTMNDVEHAGMGNYILWLKA